MTPPGADAPAEPSGAPHVEPLDPRGPSVVELVFAGEPRNGRRRFAFAGAVVVALYASGLAALDHLGLRPAAATARTDAVAVERPIDVTPPERPRPPAPEAASGQARLAPAGRRPRATRSAPAAAAPLAAAAPAPADFTGTVFIAGTSATYAGGSTSPSGTSAVAASGAVSSDGTGAARADKSRARPVSLDEAAWSCPWPAEADAQQVNEQTVVLRAAVRADGRVEHVEVLADPGFGFGAAARLCALATRFAPARDPAGEPVAALSPPLRVHFLR